MSESEREALAKVMTDRRNECRQIFMYEPQIPSYVEVLGPVVDQIATARVDAAVRAALEAAAEAVTAKCVGDPFAKPCKVCRDAASIVRAHSP